MLFAPRLPMLLVVAAGIAALLLWDGPRSRSVTRDYVPWAMTALVLVALAMVILLVAVPAPLPEQGLRALILAEGGFGIWLMDRRGRRGPDRGR